MKFLNTYTRLEIFCNAISSRRRIEILNIIYEEKNISLEKIAELLPTSKQNASLHTYKLLHQGLIAKRKNGLITEHIITQRGKKVLSFIKSIDKTL